MKGFIKVNEQQQTDDPSIYAIGDCAGGVLLAHKATREAALRGRNHHRRIERRRPVCRPGGGVSPTGSGVVRPD